MEKDCEDADKCLIVVPIKPGMYVISLCCVLGGLSNFFYGLDAMRANSFWGLGFLVGAGLQVLAALLYFKWLLRDTKETREGLQKAAVLNVIAWLVLTIWALVGSVTFLGAMIPFAWASNWIVNFLWALYVWTVCAKFAEQNP